MPAEESCLRRVTPIDTGPWSGRSSRCGACGHVAVDSVVKCIWFLQSMMGMKYERDLPEPVPVVRT